MKIPKSEYSDQNLGINSEIGIFGSKPRKEFRNRNFGREMIRLLIAVTLSVGDVFMEVIHEYPDITVQLTLFNAVIAEGIPQKLEHNDIRWITPAEIPQYDFCPADVEILDKIMELKA